MPTIRRRTVLRSFVAVTAAATLTLATTTQATAGAGRAVTATTVLSAAVVPGLSQLTDLGPSAPGDRVEIGVTVTNPHAAERAATYAAMTTPGSAMYGRVLTAAQYDATFAVPAATTARVADAVTGDGLTLAYTSTDGGYLLLHGTVAQVDRTFDVDLRDYRGGDGAVHRANPVGATVPVGVQAVLGLTTFDVSHVHQDTCVPGMCTGTIVPRDLYSVYDLPDSARGAGQKIAIFGEGSLAQPLKDLRTFEDDSNVGIIKDGTTVVKAPLPKVDVKTVFVDDDQVSTAGDVEWDIDAQSSTSMAPDLDELQYYFGTDLSSAAIAGTYQAWVDDPAGAMTGNSSFGGCETLQTVLGFVATADAILMHAAMLGRTMFVSTGDTGGGGCLVGPTAVNGVDNGGVPAQEYPGTSRYVVAVGGTVLYTKTTGATTRVQQVPAVRMLEDAWTHTGGGPSYSESQIEGQKGIAVIAAPCATDNAGNPTTSTAPCRGVPDVAALSGDLLTAFGIIADGTMSFAGGTSLSSPLWAGMWARMLSAHPATCATTYAGGSTKLGFAQPVLYALAKNAARDATDFFDVGNTDGTSSPTGNGQFTPIARSVADPTGWDYVSGLGVPDVAHIMADLNCGNLTQQSPTGGHGTVTVVNTTAAPVDPGSPTTGCTDGRVTDPAGDASTTGVGAEPGNDALDLLTSAYSSTSAALTVKATVTDLSAAVGGLVFDWYFTYNGTDYLLTADDGGGSGDTFTLAEVVGGAALADSTDLTGSFTEATNTVTVTVTLAEFNTATATTSPLKAGSTLTALTTYSGNANTMMDSTTWADRTEGTCSYVVGSDVTTPTTSPSATPTASATPSATASATPSASATASASPSVTATSASPSVTATSASPSASPSLSASPSESAAPSATAVRRAPRGVTAGRSGDLYPHQSATGRERANPSRLAYRV